MNRQTDREPIELINNNTISQTIGNIELLICGQIISRNRWNDSQGSILIAYIPGRGVVPCTTLTRNKTKHKAI